MEYFYLNKTGLTTFWNKCKSMFIKSSLKGKANGVFTLDSNGFVPLSQLGNIDTTFAEVITELPTTNIKKHIYMMKTDTTGGKNIYAEYIYIGDVTSTYDTNKLEKLGEASTSIDLSDYVKTTILTTELNKKVNKITGKDLSSNDFMNEYKTKLTSLTEINDDFINLLE